MARITRIAMDLTLAKIKSLKPAIGIAWQYFKIEAAPPLTIELLDSPKAKNFEDVISGKTDNLIKAIESQIKQAENEEQRQKEEREKEKNLRLKLADKIEKEDFKAIYKTENKDLNVKGDGKLQSSKQQSNIATAAEETKNSIPVPKSAEKSVLDVKKKKLETTKK
ncbi:uncharacterized protein LOC121729320 isoform X2 [Aricia agestis]|uniref:uncharacterized protein LOC121729320 isoform X2 n=1 Tax=Aricia agestis TaxID=91739 RepID=UPI001C2077B7|nr:uncharacterized protein LOC121729320 isoform X2 [Aricia agestis]